MTRCRSKDHKIWIRKTCNSNKEDKDKNHKTKVHNTVYDPPVPEHKLGTSGTCSLDQPADACLRYRIWFLLQSLDEHLSCCWPLPSSSNPPSKFITHMLNRIEVSGVDQPQQDLNLLLLQEVAAKHRISYRTSCSQILTFDMLTHYISTDVGRMVQVLQDNLSVVVILGLLGLGWSLTLSVTAKCLLNSEFFVSPLPSCLAISGWFMWACSWSVWHGIFLLLLLLSGVRISQISG